MKLSLIVPVYAEESCIEPFLRSCVPVLERLTPDFEILFCLDPSPDQTEEALLAASKRFPSVKVLTFSRRFGQPMATLAGLDHASGDAMVVMDVDLQDPPELIEPMVSKWREGFDVVYARRRHRRGLNPLYVLITTVAYRVIRWISKPLDIPLDVGDFRLLSRRAVETLRLMPETDGYLRGMTAFAGFRQTSIEFDRPDRVSGQPKYSGWTGSVRIGLNGIFGFSRIPLALLGWGGVFFVVVSVGLCMSSLPRITSALPVFLTGVLLAGMWLLGEYIGRIYDEVRLRPRYVIDRKLGFDGKTDL